MSSFSGSRNPSSLTVSAEPVVVITCPACCTKFAVEGSAVTALDVPRFHCSRCDQIFLLDSPHTAESPASQLPKSENNNPRWVLSNPSKIIEDLQPSQDSASTPIEPEELSFGAPGWLPPSMQQQALRTPPIAPANIDLQPELLSMSSGISLLAQGRTNLEAHQPSGGFSPTPTRRAQVPQPPRAQHIENQPRMRPSAGQAIGEAKLSAENENMLAALGKEATLGLSERILKSLSVRTRGLAKLSAPILAALVLLLLVSYSARVSPQSTDSLLSLILPSVLADSVPETPPNDLTLRDLSLRFVRTPSREMVAIVSGKALNGSNETIQHVTLEAIGFNERGEIVVSSKAPLSSALSNEKVSELDVDTIGKFQMSLGVKGSSIGPAENIQFSVALLDNTKSPPTNPSTDTLAKIKFFSARVFSVR